MAETEYLYLKVPSAASGANPKGEFKFVLRNPPAIPVLSAPSGTRFKAEIEVSGLQVLEVQKLRQAVSAREDSGGLATGRRQFEPLSFRSATIIAVRQGVGGYMSIEFQF